MYLLTDDYFFTDKKISRRYFFNQFKVRENTYAYTIVSKIFNSLCINRQNLNILYNKYYKLEFDNILVFLNAKYGLEYDLAKFFVDGYMTDLELDPYRYKVSEFLQPRFDDNEYYFPEIPKLLDTIFGGKYED